MREEELQLSEVVGVVKLALDEAVSVVIQSFCGEGLGCFVEDCCRSGRDDSGGEA